MKLARRTPKAGTLKVPGGKRSAGRVKIVGAKMQGSPTTEQPFRAVPVKHTRLGDKSGIAQSFHDPAVVNAFTKTRKRVKRLFVKDPYNKLSTSTVATFAPEADQFTNNPNRRFDPSKAPGSVKEISVPLPPRGTDTGHQKVIKPNRTTLLGGKTLKRR